MCRARFCASRAAADLCCVKGAALPDPRENPVELFQARVGDHDAARARCVRARCALSRRAFRRSRSRAARCRRRVPGAARLALRALRRRLSSVDTRRSVSRTERRPLTTRTAVTSAARRAARAARARAPFPCAPLHQVVLRRLGEVRQAQQVGDGAARAADGLRRGFVRQAEFVDQPLRARSASSSGFRSSRWMFSISASASADVVGHALDERRHLLQPGALRRAPAPLAGDDLEAARRRPGARGSAASRPARGSTRRARRAPPRPSACAAGTCPGCSGRSRASAARSVGARVSLPPESSASRPRPSPFGRIMACLPLRGRGCRVASRPRRSISPASAR